MSFFEIYGQQKGLTQWDVGRKLIVREACSSVHYTIGEMTEAVVCPVTEVNGLFLAPIPDELLQISDMLHIYAYVGTREEGYTRKEGGFFIKERPKPENYVYTPTQAMTWEALEERIEALEKGGAGGGGTGVAEKDGKSVFYTPMVTYANTSYILLKDITIPDGYTVSAGDLILSVSGYLYSVLSTWAENTDGAEARISMIANLKGEPGAAGDDGKDGYSVLRINKESGAFGGTVIVSDIAKPNGYTVKKGDMLLSTDGYLYAITTVYWDVPGEVADVSLLYSLQGPEGPTGTPGKDYILTDADKGEIAELAAELVEVPDSSQNPTVAAAAIDYDQNVKAINHRGYSTIAPENTVPAYILSKEKGFKYVETDVSFTSDGVAVLLHDASIDRTSTGSGNISGMTYAEASKYDYGSWMSEEYKGTRIPTFEEFIKLCKNLMLHPYIELKSNGSYTKAQIKSLVEMVNKYGMNGKVTWISFAAAYLEYVKEADPKARLGYLSSADVTADIITTVQNLQTDGNEVFLDLAYYRVTDDAVALCVNAGIPLEAWTVDSNNWIAGMNPYITGVTSNNVIAGKVLHESSLDYKYSTDLDGDSTEETALLRISANYSGGAVTAGTAVSDLAGIIVTAHYSDGSSKAVSGYTLSGTITEGSNTITVTYQDKITTFTVTGVASGGSTEETTLLSISATYSGGAVTAGTAVSDLTGIIVTAHYSDGSSKAVSGYTLSGTITEGSNTITATYQDKTTTFTVTGIASGGNAGGDTGEESKKTLVYNWDLTQSLTDTVSGVALETSGTAVTQDGNGLTITNASSGARIPADVLLQSGDTVEIDIANMEHVDTSDHSRLVILRQVGSGTQEQHGVIYRSTGAWDIYMNGWAGSTTVTDPNAFANKTMKIEMLDKGCNVYVDDQLVTYTQNLLDGSFKLGCYSKAYYNVTFTGLRVYRRE